MELLFSILIGVALSATSGLRIFVPFLVMSLASRAGYLEVASSFEWVASTPALIAFSVAAVVEIAAYSIPYIDDVLSFVSIPVTALAGIILTLSVITELDPLLLWSLAIIAGGGTSMITRLSSTTVHLGSTVTTGGLSNFFVSLAESLLSVILAIFAILFPLLVFIILGLMVLLIIRWVLFKKSPVS